MGQMVKSICVKECLLWVSMAEALYIFYYGLIQFKTVTT